MQKIGIREALGWTSSIHTKAHLLCDHHAPASSRHSCPAPHGHAHWCDGAGGRQSSSSDQSRTRRHHGELHCMESVQKIISTFCWGYEVHRRTVSISPCVVVREETVGGSLQTIIEFIYACPPPLQLFLQGLSADFFSLYKQSFLSGSRVTTSAEGSSPSAGHSPARPVMWAMFDNVM